jgi:hypothetical protein
MSPFVRIMQPKPMPRNSGDCVMSPAVGHVSAPAGMTDSPQEVSSVASTIYSMNSTTLSSLINSGLADTIQRMTATLPSVSNRSGEPASGSSSECKHRLILFQNRPKL